MFAVRKNRYFKGLITAFLVIIGICGIGWFTWHLGKTFIGLVSNSYAERTGEIRSADSQILNLPDIHLWTCQVGAFNDGKNAELQLDSLRQRGWKAAVIAETPYTIAVGLFADKEEAVNFCDMLSGYGINAWVKEESFPALHYKVKGKNMEDVIRILTLSNSLLRETASNAVQAKPAADAEAIFTDECPSDFVRLNKALGQVLTTAYPQDDSNYLRRQDMLHLYAEYKQTTIKFFAERQ